MDLIPVESSNIRAVGYDAERKLLRVVFRDGVVYEGDDVSQELHAAFMAASSKGRFAARYLGTILKRAGHSVGPAPEQPRPSSGPLHSHEPDDCCGKRISIALLSGGLDKLDVWTCPKCGLEWRALLDVIGVKHWHPHVYMAVVPRAV